MWGTVANVHNYGSSDEIINFMTSIYVTLETIVCCVGPVAVGLVLWQKMFNKFPGCFFKWMLYMDILAAFYAGPLRWYQNMAMASMGYPADATGCQLVAFGDTFFHVASLVMNTFVVSCIFYMVYFKSAKFSQSKTQWMGSLGAILGTALLFALFSFNGPVDNFHGWCTMDSSGVVLKLLFMCLLASVQIILVIPTLLAISATSAKSRNTTSTVMMMSFVGIIVCQLIGTIPLIVIEYVGYARIVVPFFLKEIVLIGVPLARMVNIGLVLYKVAVKTIPALQSKAKGKDLDKVGRSITSGSRSENSLSESDSRGSRLGAVSAVNYDQPGAGGTGLLPGDRSILEDMSLDQGDDETTREESTSESRSSRSSRGSTSSKKSRTGKGKNAKGKKQAGQKGDDACKIPFKYLLAVVILIPVTLQSIAVGFVYNKQSHDYNHAESAQMNIKMLETLSDVIHESQKERGATAIFMGSKGTQYQEQLAAQRNLLDSKIKILQYFLDKEYDDGAIMTNQEFAYGLGQMYLLPYERKKIDGLQISSGDALAFYTGMIKKFLHVVQAVAKNQGEDSADMLVYSTYTYLYAEERMGHERALGAGAFAAGKWGPGMLIKFIDIIASQDSARDIFAGYAMPEAVKEFNKIQKGDLAKITGQLRATALRNNNTELEATNAPYWFEQMTNYIDQIFAVEVMQAEELSRLANAQLEYDLAVVIDILIITTASLVLCGLVGLVVSQAVIGMRKKAKVSKSKKKGWRGWFDHETHLLVHCLWCVFILFILMTLVVQDETIKLRSASILVTNMHLRDALVQIMYNLQIERGATALFLGSTGQSFGTELRTQRGHTDETTHDFHSYMSTGEYSLDYILNADEFNSLIVKLEEMKGIREKVDAIAIPGPQAIGYYTTTIKLMFDVLARFITDDSVVYGHAENNMMYGLAVTMLAKETMGVERAVGSAALTNGDFANDAQWLKFVTLAKMRDAYLTYWRSFAPKDTVKIMNEEEAKEDNKMLMEWEAALIDRDFEQCISPDYFFRMMTRKINGIRDIEHMQAKDLSGFLQGIRDGSTASMAMLILSVVVSGVGGIVVYVRVRLNMIKQKKRALIPLTPSTNSRGGKFNPEEQCIKCKNDLYCPRCYERSVERLMGNEVPVIKKIEDTVPVTKKAAPGPGEEEETAPLMTKEVEVEMTK